MHHLLLLLLVGTIYAQEPENCCEENSNEIVDSYDQENNCDLPDTLETTSLDNCHLNQCPNITIEVKKGLGGVFRGKGTCTYQAFNCPTTFARAQYSCRCRRGNLCSVPNGCANNQIRGIGQRACSNRHFAWIGVWKPANSCYYVNSDGSRLLYTNFASGQYRTCGAWCVAMSLSNGLWYTLNCCTSLPYICRV